MSPIQPLKVTEIIRHQTTPSLRPDPKGRPSGRLIDTFKKAALVGAQPEGHGFRPGKKVLPAILRQDMDPIIQSRGNAIGSPIGKDDGLTVVPNQILDSPECPDLVFLHRSERIGPGSWFGEGTLFQGGF